MMNTASTASTTTHKKLSLRTPVWLGVAPDKKIDATHVPPFPTYIFPSPFVEFIEQGVEAVGCPTDFLAAFCLAFCSIAIGRSVLFRPKPNWDVFGNLYLATVGDPASKKSPAIQLPRKFLEKIEQRLYTEYISAEEMFERQEIIYKQKLKEWEKSNQSSPPPIKPKPPTLKRLSVNDTTMEALCQLLSENPMGLGGVFDELSAHLRSMNQYKGGQGSDRSHYLSCWNNARITVDRKGKVPIIIASPFLTIIGCIQPDILCEMRGKHGANDGLLERFLFVNPETEFKPAGKPKKIDPVVLKECQKCFDVLYKKREDTDTPILTFTDDAQMRFIEHENTLGKAAHSKELNPALKAFYIKMQSYVARFSLILHTVKYWKDADLPNRIDIETLNNAIDLSDYFLRHAEKTFHSVNQTQESQRVKKVVDWVERHEKKIVSPRDIYTNKVAGVEKATEAERVLRDLEDYGYGIWMSDTKRFISHIV